MRAAVRYCVAAVASMLVLAMLPSALESASMLISALPPLMFGFGFARVEPWLWVVLWLGLALVEARVPAKVLFILAAVLQMVLNASILVVLMQLVILARMAPDRISSMSGMPVFVYYLPLLAASIALSLSSGRLRLIALAGWAALAFDLGSAFVPRQMAADGGLLIGFWDQLLRAGYSLALLGLATAIAFVMFRSAREGAHVEQALRADAGSE